MSDQTKQNLPNSIKIIERFGGIRPMATKLGVPVTTVQGWKKREAIPLARKELILTAAQEHGVDLSGLMGQQTATEKATNPEEIKRPEPVQAQDAKKAGVKPEVIKSTPDNTQARPSPKPVNVQARSSNPATEKLMKQEQVQKRSTQSLINGIIGGVSLAALAGVFGLLMLTGPKVKETNQQEKRIAELEKKLEEVSTQQTNLKQAVPSDLDKRIGEIKQQTAKVTQNVTNLAEQASVITKTVMGAEGGSIAQRLQSLEGEINRFAQLSGSSDLAGFVAKLSTMQQSLEGQTKLESAMDELWGAVNDLKTSESTGSAAVPVGEALDASRQQGTALEDTLGGLGKQDLKAAAMLMGLAQLRSTLGRDRKSFDKDLALMQKLLGTDDQELNAAIKQLAPHAQNGVLSVSGLSREFRALGGEIVASSLTGEDVSWEEKAKARLNNVLKVEKNGELITGTETQERIEAAQYYLDKGDVESAYIILNDLQGPARITADDFIQQLQKTALAGQVEELLTGKVMQNVMGFDLSQFKNGLPTDFLKGLNADGLSNFQKIDAQTFKGLVDSFEKMLPPAKVLEDPISGYRILERNRAELPQMKTMDHLGQQ